MCHDVGGKVIINNAYQAYVALANDASKTNWKEEDTKHTIVYVSPEEINKTAPEKNPQIKTIKGRQKFHKVKNIAFGSNILVCEDLSCSCPVCLGKESGSREKSYNTKHYRHYVINIQTSKQTEQPLMSDEV